MTKRIQEWPPSRPRISRVLEFHHYDNLCHNYDSPEKSENPIISLRLSCIRYLYPSYPAACLLKILFVIQQFIHSAFYWFWNCNYGVCKVITMLESFSLFSLSTTLVDTGIHIQFNAFLLLMNYEFRIHLYS